MKTENKVQVPLTIYGFLARKHKVKNEKYVGEIVRGERKAIRGKAKAILQDWRKIEHCFDDWVTEYPSVGAMLFKMVDVKVSIYVQNGIARVYKQADLENEVDVAQMTLLEFNDFLNRTRMEYN